jgi:hypothetical protein
MPGIQISGTFKKGTLDQGSFAIIKADSLLIPLQIAVDIDARDAMYEYLRMPFMLCYVISDSKPGMDTRDRRIHSSYTERNCFRSGPFKC